MEETNRNNQRVSIKTLSQSLTDNQIVIHYDVDRTDYTVNEYELDSIKKAGHNIWKDVFLVCLGLGIPSLINSYSIYKNWNQQIAVFPTDLILNLVFGLVALIIGAISLYLWQINKADLEEIISKIKKKPQVIIENNAAANIKG